MATELYTTPLYNDASIISYWRMEGNSNDTKGSNNGSDTNVTYNSGNGEFGQGAGMAGTGSIVFSENAGLKPASFSVNLWFKSSSASDQDFFSQGLFSTKISGFRFWMSNITLCCDLGNNTGLTLGTQYARSTSNQTGLNDGTWKMVTATWDNASHTLKTYLNGSSVNTYSTYTGTIVYDASSVCQIGNGSLGYFNGAIDDLSLFSRALTSTEIKSLYQNWYYPQMSVGSFALTGINIALTSVRTMITAVQNFSLTGIDLTISKGKTLITAVGNFYITGVNISFTEILIRRWKKISKSSGIAWNKVSKVSGIVWNKIK